MKAIQTGTIKIEIDFKEYHKKKLAEMPKKFREDAIAFLKTWLTDEDKQLITAEHKKDPERWWAGYHFYWGMACRNALRTAGFDDINLPDKNWDDYYIPCVEIAVGVRTL